MFVNDKEKKINRRRGLTKGDKGYISGHDLFIKPVLRRQAQLLNAQNVAAQPVVVVHASPPPPPNKSSNCKVHADDIPQVSKSTDNNNRRPISESETDSEDSAEDSSSEDGSPSPVSSLVVTVSSLAVSVPLKSTRSSHGRLKPSPATTASPLRQETIPRFPGDAHGKASGVSHSNDPSGSDGLTLNAGGLVIAYPQFKAQEFNIGLSRGSKSDVIEYDLSRVVVETVPQVLQEWRYGLGVCRPVIQELNKKFGANWRDRKAVKFLYEARLGVVKEYRRLVILEGRSDTEAILFLEQQRADRSIATLYNRLKKAVPKTEKGKKSSVYGEDEPEYPKDFINQGGRVPRPPPIEETGFPITVRLINSIPNVWKEWTVGWSEGEPSIQSQIHNFNRAWNNPKFEVYENHFRYKNQLVRTIQEAMKQKVVQSCEEAIQILENIRGTMEPSTFCKSKEFKTITKEVWGITTKVEKYWLCGQY